MKLVIVRSLGLLILEEGPPGMRVGGQLSMKKERSPGIFVFYTDGMLTTWS